MLKIWLDVEDLVRGSFFKHGKNGFYVFAIPSVMHNIIPALSIGGNFRGNVESAYSSPKHPHLFPMLKLNFHDIIIVTEVRYDRRTNS